MPKAGLRLGVSVLAVVGSVQVTQTAVANGDTRTLSFYHTHSKERLTVTFKKNGRYDAAALKQLNYYLRDWRNQKQTNMDPRLFDVLWEVYKDAGARDVIQIVSSYRSPETNAGLRSRTKGVAEHSQHTLGKAMDIHIDGIAMSKVREAGLRLQRGGVGFYPTSGLPFVHLDVGNVRHWPRMSRDQLVRVFPDGRTVHVPTDGKPLKNYALAMADIRRNGATVKGQKAIPASEIMMASNSKSGGNFLSRLLSGGEDDEETTTAVAAPVAVAAARIPAPSQTTPAQAVAKRAPEAPVAAPEPSAPVAVAQIVPVPQARPSLGYAAEPELASAPQMAWARGAEATPALRGSDAAAARSKAQLEMAALVAAAQTTTPAPVAAAPEPVALASVAMPVPRPQNAVPAPVTPAAMVAQADVPLPTVRPTISGPVATASLGLSGADAARLLASAVRRMASGEVAGPAKVVAAPQPVASAKAKAEALAPTAVAQERSVHDADVALAAPQLAGVEALIAAPVAIVPVTFGGNPTAGLRSDAFAGASVATLRTEAFGGARGARIVDVAPRG